jgi:hypothetical protein
LSRRVECFRPEHVLQKADANKWDALLLTLLFWLNDKKAELIKAPNSLGFFPNTLDGASCTTLSEGVVNLCSLECFSMYLRNAISNILGMSLVGTVLQKEFLFGCAGQFEYRLSPEGQKQFQADYCLPVSPARRHHHGGRVCHSDMQLLTSGEYQDAVTAYCGTFANIPGRWVSNSFCNFLLRFLKEVPFGSKLAFHHFPVLRNSSQS